MSIAGSIASITEPTLVGVLVGLPALAVATRLARIRGGRAVALLQDATPLVLVLAWVGHAVSMYCSVEPDEMGMIDIGELRVASAKVPVGGAVLHVVGAIPTAAVDPGGYATWKREMAALTGFAGSRQSPLVIAGDLNTTIHRAAYRDLAEAGLDDAHDDLGLGLRPSFKLAATGLLAKLGPLVRLDHALTNRWVWATEVHDLASAGSDHRPFVATLAVRPPRGTRSPAAAAPPVRAEQQRPLVPSKTAEAQRVLPPSDARKTSPITTTPDRSTR